MPNYRDAEPKHLFELSGSDIELILDGLSSLEESMSDIAEVYKNSRTDSYYAFWKDRAVKAKRLRERITEQTGVELPSMEEYSREADAFTGSVVKGEKK